MAQMDKNVTKGGFLSLPSSFVSAVLNLLIELWMVPPTGRSKIMKTVMTAQQPEDSTKFRLPGTRPCSGKTGAGHAGSAGGL